MKLTITFKDPDGVYEAVRSAVAASLADFNLDDNERELLEEKRIQKHMDTLGKWVEDEEYLSVDFDLATMTATVKEVA